MSPEEKQEIIDAYPAALYGQSMLYAKLSVEGSTQLAGMLALGGSHPNGVTIWTDPVDVEEICERDEDDMPDRVWCVCIGEGETFRSPRSPLKALYQALGLEELLDEEAEDDDD